MHLKISNIVFDEMDRQLDKLFEHSTTVSPDVKPSNPEHTPNSGSKIIHNHHNLIGQPLFHTTQQHQGHQNNIPKTSHQLKHDKTVNRLQPTSNMNYGNVPIGIPNRTLVAFPNINQHRLPQPTVNSVRTDSMLRTNTEHQYSHQQYQPFLCQTGLPLMRR